MKMVQGEEDYISLSVLATALATYVGLPVWVGLVTSSIANGIFTFILIAFWLADIFEFRKSKDKK